MRRMLHTNVVYVVSYASGIKIIMATWKLTSKVRLLNVILVSWNNIECYRGELRVGCRLFSSVFSVKSVQCCMVGWRMMNWKGLGRKWSLPNWGTIPAFAWGDWKRKPQKHQFSQDGQHPGKDLSQHLANISLEYYFWWAWG